MVAENDDLNQLLIDGVDETVSRKLAVTYSYQLKCIVHVITALKSPLRNNKSTKQLLHSY